MIFLIEDKSSRREDYGWSDKKISSTSEILTVVENAISLNKLWPDIFKCGNVILFHESFAQRETVENKKLVYSIQSRLENSDNIYVAFFSGSNSQSKMDGNRCSLHVQTLYANLDVFISHCENGIVDFRYLMFGEHPQIEENLLQLIRKTNQNNIISSYVNCEKKLLVFRTAEDAIQFPVSNAVLKNGCDYNCSDSDLLSLVKEQSLIQYDAIYIPLCMGETLSDFLGLRLAMFYRLYESINKYAHIFIYGVADSTLLLKNECAEILKMPSVDYIPAECKYFIKSLNDIRRINNVSYRLGLKSIHLNVPSNIGDNHSIANKWGIYRWSLALDGDDDDIEKNNEEIYNSLYFRYLTALYPPSKIKQINKDDLKLPITPNDEAIMPQLNILYIDDEADEGWCELLCQIIYDINNIKDFEHIGRELKNMTVDEIVNHVMNKITESNINVVILDLRLHSSDFNEANIRNITGYKLLEKIKHHNRGIQVLMFSATNKIWNLQALQEKEVDGFVMKEAPENSVDKDYTVHSIIQFTKALSDCTLNTYKIKLWATIQKEKEHISLLRKRKQINAEYAKAIEVLLRMTEDAIFSKDLQYAYATAFMNLFRIIEATSNEWIDPNVVIENAGKESVRSYFKFRKNDSQLLEFSPKKYNPNPQKKLFYYKENPTLSYFQKICNTLHVVGAYNINAFNIVIKRNNFTHPNLIENSEVEKFSVCDVLSVFDLVEQLIMNQ